MQDEVKRLIQAANEANLVAQLEEAAKQHPRTMVFFRWYGVDMKSFLNVPAFHQPWKYIETIGVSVFNKKVSTSKHFGFMRASLRVLYNLNDMKDDTAYIVVGDKTSYWRENKLFIFDDTLLHRVVQRDRPDALLPVRRHGPSDAIAGRHARRYRRHPLADPEFQIHLLPELEAHRALVVQKA